MEVPGFHLSQHLHLPAVPLGQRLQPLALSLYLMAVGTAERPPLHVPVLLELVAAGTAQSLTLQATLQLLFAESPNLQWHMVPVDFQLA